jgi:hypothetical protein
MSYSCSRGHSADSRTGSSSSCGNHTKTNGLYDPGNFCITEKMFRKKGTIGWLIDNKLIEMIIFEGSTLH